MRNIIFIAPPAAGKGTVSDYLVKNFGYEHLSTGDLLREEIKSGSDLGKEIEKIISRGNLVSDEFIIQMVEGKLESLKDKPFILDGFPRTLTQAKKLDEMLLNLGVPSPIAIYLEISLEEAMKRALGRVTCPNCKRGYNVYNEKLKPKVDHICDDCGSVLEHRSDDNEETFKVRFDSYITNTSPILEYYQNANILKTVDVSRDLNEIFEDITKEAKND